MRIATRVVAFVTVPVALSAFDIPTKAMNLNFPALRPEVLLRKSVSPQPRTTQLPILTAPTTRENFISASAVRQLVSIDSFKEHYFRTSVPYGAIIYREAKRNGLPPELVAAMVHTESDFQPKLVSDKSAQGLMQIIPETAHDLGLANVFDPEQNIAAGTRYFRYLLDRFENERIALAAYNAGEGKVERCSCVPEIAETQQYVEKVHIRANRYRQRVQNGYMASLRLRSSIAQ